MKNLFASTLIIMLLLVASCTNNPASKSQAPAEDNNTASAPETSVGASLEANPQDAEAHQQFMRKAIALSVENVENGGGPFGAVIVKDGAIVATGVNRVTANNDPTAHAEVSAIRNACQELQSFDLTGCTLYTSCEPCPMCLGAIYWAHFDKVYYGNTKTDAKEIDFDDSFIYDEIALQPKDRRIKTTQLLRNEAMVAFDMWRNRVDKTAY